MSVYRAGYSRPPGSSFELSPRRVALLLLVAGASAAIGYLAGRSLGGHGATPSSLAGTKVQAPNRSLSTRLRPAPGIANLSLPKPRAAPTPTPATTTLTNPAVPSPTPTPDPSAPAPQPAPSPAPSPTPSAPSGGGGSFDDSG